MQNSTGQKGEFAFGSIITRRYRKNEDLFDPRPLGEKKPITDFYVELTGERKVRPYFFVQVKATRAKQNNIRVNLSADEISKMRCIPAPVYLVGIELDDRDGGVDEAFLLAVDKFTKGGVYYIPKIYPINAQNLEMLYEEVLDYWFLSHNKKRVKKSAFSR
jgi:hypothetical protein